ncbi:TonB family protein [Methylomonas koyamae]|uniref:Protein TonB n=2 Tax=Methylomonas koyamae TaxID=702114 RepID=A0A291IDY2_9GAMM|nr:TonB family protein [Methylomonas koyamae]OAI27152.1 hypothetical protein A1356_09705 [Methylomonas koyamae]
MLFTRADQNGFVIARNPLPPFAAAGLRRTPEPAAGAYRKERSSNLSVLAAILSAVAAMHFFGVRCLFCPSIAQAVAQPIAMQVSTIKIRAAQTAPARPAPPQAAKPAKKKPQPKPKLKTIVPQAPASDFSAFDQVLDQAPKTENPISRPELAPDAAAGGERPAFTEAYLSAAYQHNPKPEYPSIARSRGWQGKVLLRVQVDAEGRAEAVALEQSCGHDMLDESALEAVKQWRFVPAKRDDVAVASSVLVPIIFSLQDDPPLS